MEVATNNSESLAGAEAEDGARHLRAQADAVSHQAAVLRARRAAAAKAQEVAGEYRPGADGPASGGTVMEGASVWVVLWVDRWEPENLPEVVGVFRSEGEARTYVGAAAAYRRLYDAHVVEAPLCPALESVHKS